MLELQRITTPVNNLSGISRSSRRSNQSISNPSETKSEWSRSTKTCSSPNDSRDYSLRTQNKKKKKNVGALIDHFTLFKKKIKKELKTRRRKNAEKRQLENQHLIKKLIQSSAQKILTHKLSTHELNIAINYFNEHFKNTKTYKKIAMITLLAVIHVYYSGNIKAMLHLNWINQFTIPNYNPFYNESFGTLPSSWLDTVERSLTFDPLGISTKYVLDLMQTSGFIEKLIPFLESHGFIVNKEKLTVQPSPMIIYQYPIKLHQFTSTENTCAVQA